MSTPNNEPNKYLLSSLNNALDILNELATQPDMGITELSNKLNMGKSSVFRTLYTLEKRGFVRKVADSRYSLGMRLAILGKITSNQIDDFAVLHYVLENLAKKTRMAVYLTILNDDCNVVFVDSAFGDALLQFRAKTDAQYPAYCSGGGKVLLSYLLGTENESKLYGIDLLPRTPTSITNVQKLRETLETVRAQGYGVDNCECESELICYGMPVCSKDGACICALSVSGPKQTMLENKEHFLSNLKESVYDLESYAELLQEYISYYKT